ncbi:36180_t:CDS:2, partial [Racocetra persica]
FNHKNQDIKKDNITFYYKCSQSQVLENKPRKNIDPNKQQDKVSIEQFSCNRLLKIIIRDHQIADINLVHKILHTHPNQFEIDTSIKKQIHYWWTVFIRQAHFKNIDQLKSAYKLLVENKNEIILYESNATI